MSSPAVDEEFPVLTGNGIGFVYAVECRGPNPDYPIKVGYTANRPTARLSLLQVGCPYPLVLLGVLPNKGIVDEDRLHMYLARDRLDGEWFKRRARMEVLIARLDKYGSDDPPVRRALPRKVRLEIFRDGSDLIVADHSRRDVYLRTKDSELAVEFRRVASYKPVADIEMLARLALGEAEVDIISFGR